MEFGKKHVLIWGSIFLLLVGLVLAVRQMYVMFAVLALLAPVSYLLSRDTLGSLEVRREAPGLMKENQQRPVRLVVTNTGVRRRYFFTIGDELPDGLAVVGETGGRTLVPSLANEEEFRFEYTLEARWRGVFKLGPASLKHSDLIGLFNFDRRIGQADELVVHPTPVQIPQVWTRVASLRAPERPRRRFRGEGTEFYGTRPFVPGDDLRRVDWNATARRGHLVVREYERAEATDATIVLDLEQRVHRGKGDDATIERAVKLTASVAVQLLERGSSVGLVAAGEDDFSVAPSAAPHQTVKLMDALARVQADAKDVFATAVAEHLPYIPDGGMAIIISPRLDEESLSLASSLLDRGHSVSWMIVEALGAPSSGEIEAHRLAARLVDRGVDAWTLAAGRPISLSLRRVRRGG
ncbi:MAG: DUF58 domain-containing protein [Armatimonadota bacterium]|jgi:uncharacterized protein (DUF58 family)